ncbi:hypothetical protein S245_038643, partial [Arachis hypogaea]
MLDYQCLRFCSRFELLYFEILMFDHYCSPFISDFFQFVGVLLLVFTIGSHYSAGWNSSAANATKFQKYLAAENGGGADLVANCTSASASGWETFKLWRVSDTSFNFRVFNKQFLGMENQGSGSIIEAPPSNRRTLDTFGQRTSIYRGVTRHKWTGRYKGHLWDNSYRREGQSRKGSQVYLGGYDKEDKAARLMIWLRHKKV